jgi:hypothetical protein
MRYRKGIRSRKGCGVGPRPVCTTLAPLERPILTCLESFYGRAVDLNLTWIMHRASAARFQSRIRTSVRSSEEWPTTVQRSKLIANWSSR